MSKFLIAVTNLIVGVLIGGVAGMSLGTGVGAGVGIATGLSSGICVTVKAAQDKGLVTAEQVDEIMIQASKTLGSEVELAEGDEIVGTAAQCDTFLAELKEAASN